MRLAVIDLDWLDKRIEDSKTMVERGARLAEITITDLTIVKEHTVPLLHSFTLSTLNLQTPENRHILAGTKADVITINPD